MDEAMTFPQKLGRVFAFRCFWDAQRMARTV